MEISLCFLYLFVFYDVSVESCYVTNYIELNEMERFLQSEYVVYGQTVNHVVRELTFYGRKAYITDAVFDVHCILKGPNGIPERITISGISPRYGCSGTNIGELLSVNTSTIIGIKNNSASTFAIDEVMPNLSAGVIPYKLFFASIGNLCGMQNWRSPINANVSRCPICGTTNYGTYVLQHPDISSLLMCVYVNQTITDPTQCDYYLPDAYGTVEAQTCIPSTFSQSCVTLEYRNASLANCDCNRNSDGSIFTDGCDQTFISSVLVCALALLWTVIA